MKTYERKEVIERRLKTKDKAEKKPKTAGEEKSEKRDPRNKSEGKRIRKKRKEKPGRKS